MPHLSTFSSFIFFFDIAQSMQANDYCFKELGLRRSQAPKGIKNRDLGQGRDMSEAYQEAGFCRYEAAPAFEKKVRPPSTTHGRVCSSISQFMRRSGPASFPRGLRGSGLPAIGLGEVEPASIRQGVPIKESTSHRQLSQS